MIKKLLLIFAASLTLVIAPVLVSTVKAEQASQVDFYWKVGCQYCEKEQKFLDSIAPKYPNLKINRLEVGEKQNAEKLVAESQKLGFNPNSVPVTIIGQNVISGYTNDETTGKEIVQAIENPNLKFSSNGRTCEVGSIECKVEEKTVTLPFFGTINIGRYSIPVITLILGLADGFNPCAMWALVALLGLLIGLNSYKKLVIIGGTFILFSYLIYLAFMAAWLNAFLYLGYIKGIQVAVGVLGIIVGFNYLRDWLRTDPTTCKVVKQEKRTSIIFQIKKVVNHNFLPVALVGVILLAIAVNAIEALCSIGIPTVYTKILADAGLNKAQYYSYLAAYNVFYMFDDLIVFGAAVATRKIVHPSPKVGYWSKLVGGILVIILGLIFIFKPEFLSLT